MRVPFLLLHLRLLMAEGLLQGGWLSSSHGNLFYGKILPHGIITWGTRLSLGIMGVVLLRFIQFQWVISLRWQPKGLVDWFPLLTYLSRIFLCGNTLLSFCVWVVRGLTFLVIHCLDGSTTIRTASLTISVIVPLSLVGSNILTYPSVACCGPCPADGLR